MVNEPLSSLVVAFESSQTARSASRPDPSMLAEDKAYSYQNLNPAGFVDVLGELKPNIPFLDAGGKVNKSWRMWLRCVLAYIILVSDPYMNTALSSRGVGLERVLDDHPDMLKWVYQATVLDGDDRVIRLLKILRVDCPGPLIRCNDTSQALYVVDSSFKKGAVDSWRIPFRGRSARLLHAILMDHMKIDQLGRHDARYTTHIQSAGTGKSRAHDELAKHVLYIPLNLAPNDTTCQCYPPPDRNIGVWINKSCKIDDHYTRKRLQGFFYALFTVTERRLNDIQNDPQLNIPSRKIEDIDPDAVDADPPIGTTNRDRSILRATLFRLARLSRAFRERLASGCTFEAHGEYRWTFYEEVQVEADKFVLTCVLDRATSTETYVTQSNDSMPTAAKKLAAFLNPLGVRTGYLPLTVICIDEAHRLMGWSPGNLFHELLHSLNRIQDLPFFTVFLLDAVKLRVYPPIRGYSMNPFPPIVETGFDEFASRVDVRDRTWTLSRIASTHHIAHLGRSLFPARYDAGDPETKKNIVAFARTQLLRGSGASALHDAMKLACLSVRLGLNFRAAQWKDGGEELAQVEHHMRMCLSVMADSYNMTTAVASEPLLAEAASEGMTDASWGAADALLSHIDKSHVDPGDRGEIVAALLLLLARDMASKETRLDPAKHADLDEDGFATRRVVKVTDFLVALLKADVLGQLPARYAEHRAEDRDRPLRDTFQEGHIWFNHFVKADDLDVFNDTDYLARLIVRGAAVICPNNQRGVDIIVPVLFGTVLHPDSVSAILVQVKTDRSYTTSPREYTFEAMDPFQVGIFPDKGRSDAEAARPVIRMVFALASSRSGTSCPSSASAPDKFTAYDIWCAGTSHETFIPIREQEADVYDSLLTGTRGKNTTRDDILYVFR